MQGRVSQYVLKVCSRCDLSCDHCYVYEHADQSWRHKPRGISPSAVAAAAQRIAEHAGSHRLPGVSVVLHGGEPLLLGPDGLRMVLRELTSAISPVTQLNFAMHTNGVRLDRATCDLFAEYAVQVGVSLDGDQPANDRHRRFADGRGSHDQVLRALALLREPEYRHLYAGILCTIDLANDPDAVYEALLAQAPPRLDLLLPHATWDAPPPRPPGRATPYADWLGRVHARWVSDGRPVPVRLFDSLTDAWAGRRSGSEAVGLDPVDMLVIETDGSWEQADSLKTAFDGAPATGQDVFSHSVDDALAHPGIAARMSGVAGLCRACRQCELARACGGGLYAHRYRTGTGFDNPSVYCADLKALIPAVIAGTESALVNRPRAVAAAPTPDDGQDAHRLPDEAFAALARGPGDIAAMAALSESRWSVNRALTVAVASQVTDATELGRAAAEGWQLLSQLDRTHPGAVREVLSYPYVQAWAARCLRGRAGGGRELDLAHLASIAVAASLRAGTETELSLPVRNGIVYLPAVGAFAAGTEAGPTLRVRASPDGVSSRQGLLPCKAIRQLATGPASVTIDDIDPFRDCGAWVPTGRLTVPEWRSWRHRLTDAVAQLTADLPGYADVAAKGLLSVVPIRPGPAGQRHSSTSRDAVGAIGVALPDDASSLSELLVHEMQHVKMAAIADMHQLFVPGDDRRYHVHWRADSRPIEGVLHGTYAHLALADLWLSRSRRDPAGHARQRFAMYRSWVESAIEVMLASGSLLPDGERLAVGMRSAAKAWDCAR